jgi:hypothetical protein
LDLCPVHDAPRFSRKFVATVHDAAIVPYYQIADPPAVMKRLPTALFRMGP